MAQQSELREEIEELRGTLTETRAELRKIQACLEAYRPFLDELRANDTYWSQIRREVLLHTLKGSAWALVGAVVLIVAIGAKDWLRRALS